MTWASWRLLNVPSITSCIKQVDSVLACERTWLDVTSHVVPHDLDQHVGHQAPDQLHLAQTEPRLTGHVLTPADVLKQQHTSH